MSDTLDIAVVHRADSFELRVTEHLPLADVTAVFGPSGAGKSSLLRVLAGFAPAAGSVRFADELWLDNGRQVTPPHRRGVGYMVQDAPLFAHLDVAGNLNYAARRAPGAVDLDELIAAFDLENLLARRVDALSGGERKRVMLARTLATLPRLLLLDEPLAGLDRDRRYEILPYLESLSARFKIPLLYVSHDIDEVARLAQRMLVLASGQVLAHGPTDDILKRLDLQPVLGDFEAGAVVLADVASHDAEFGLSLLRLDGQALVLPTSPLMEAGSRVRVRVRARDVALALTPPEGLSIRNVLSARIAALVPTTGPFAEVVLDLGEQSIRARITRASVVDLGLSVDLPVFALIKSATLDQELR